MKRLHIFRAGWHQNISGQTLSFSEADLAASAAAYNPALHEAPIVIGHPGLDAPAYGWTKSLTASGDGITAIPHQVNPEFSEAAQQGAYKKISVSFYSPESPGNPVKGVYYLKHVVFFGCSGTGGQGPQGDFIFRTRGRHCGVFRKRPGRGPATGCGVMAQPAQLAD